MPFAAVNGTELYYEVHGAGPPLVLAHGGGANHASWWQQLPRLAAEYEVVLYDMRGFGLSGADGQTDAALVDDLAALLDTLGYDRVTLLGQSIGAFAVGGFTARHPERVQALVLTSGAGGLVEPNVPPAKPYDGPMPSYLDIRDMLIRRGAFPERHPELCVLIEQLATFNHRVDVRVLGAPLRVVHDLAPIAAAGIPTLLLTGDEDTATVEAMTALAAALPSASLVVIPDAGHLVYIEAPSVYNEHVLSFLREHVPVTNFVD